MLKFLLIILVVLVIAFLVYKFLLAGKRRV